jgi:hypothetical protein
MVVKAIKMHSLLQKMEVHKRAEKTTCGIHYLSAFDVSASDRGRVSATTDDRKASDVWVVEISLLRER